MIWFTVVWWRHVTLLIVTSSNGVSFLLYQDINLSNDSLMLVAPMGNLIKIGFEMQYFGRWLMLQYTVEPTMYPYPCVLCGVYPPSNPQPPTSHHQPLPHPPSDISWRCADAQIAALWFICGIIYVCKQPDTIIQSDTDHNIFVYI